MDTVKTTNVTWSTANATVHQCAKCSGDGKYFYRNKALGNCYGCKGLGLVIEGKIPTQLQRFERQVASAVFNTAENQVIIYYITRDKIGDITPWKKTINLSGVTEETKAIVRQLWKLAKHTAKDMPAICTAY
jgi:excinuclease UvrABC ATPase subunit